MTEHVTVVHVIGGTVTETVYTAERVTVQLFDSGRALLKTFRNGRIVRYVHITHAELIERETNPEEHA